MARWHRPARWRLAASARSCNPCALSRCGRGLQSCRPADHLSRFPVARARVAARARSAYRLRARAECCDGTCPQSRRRPSQQGADHRWLDEPGRLAACGLVVVNPPWTLARELAILLPELAAVLSAAAG